MGRFLAAVRSTPPKIGPFAKFTLTLTSSSGRRPDAIPFSRHTFFKRPIEILPSPPLVDDKNLRYRMWIFDQAHVTFMILRLRSFISKRNVINIFFLSVEFLKKISSNDVNINNPALRVPPAETRLTVYRRLQSGNE